MNKKILNLAIPNIITNITVPLLGMVDLAIVGHLGNEQYIGAIALGSTIFNLIYWNFGFLRMGTSGFTAQAFGANNMKESLSIMVRGLTIAIVVSVLLILLQQPIAFLSRNYIKSTPQVMDFAIQYFMIRIWAAPATLGMYVIKGWFIGMQNARLPMIVAIILNIINILLSLLFAVYLKMDIKGIALGTVIAQYSGLLISIVLWFIKYGELKKYIKIKECLVWNELKNFFKVNTDIFLRTLFLSIVFAFIPFISAKMGDRVLSVNTLLMQLFTIFSYILDGFAYAGESLIGRFIGARDHSALKKSISYLLRWGAVLTILFTVAYLFWSEDILSILTNDNSIITSSRDYIKWVILIPICGFSAFIFDGVYIGATASKAMFHVMLIATATFFISFYCLNNIYHNNAIWIAFLLFLLIRGGLMWILYPKKIRIKENE